MSHGEQITSAEFYVRAPADFPPPWAQRWGYDVYGIWADLCLPHGVVQRLRWIEPGHFMMGSPENEAERNDNEGPQHLVTVNTGFWLADTACTQELWQTVMGKNPAHFHNINKGGPQHPVEQISWLDAQEFLIALQKHVQEAHASLPTEAEWEYACRADTTTPFSFGENIHPQLVNYDGNRPYAGAKKGINRQQTVAVKALAANPWGLYQMHGNVWEWCEDVLRENYAQALDAGGKDLRAFRGGSWFSFAQFVRSAYRNCDGPDRRYSNLGFRFVLRSSRPLGP